MACVFITSMLIAANQPAYVASLQVCILSTHTLYLCLCPDTRPLSLTCTLYTHYCSQSTSICCIITVQISSQQSVSVSIRLYCVQQILVFCKLTYTLYTHRCLIPTSGTSSNYPLNIYIHLPHTLLHLVIHYIYAEFIHDQSCSLCDCLYWVTLGTQN